MLTKRALAHLLANNLCIKISPTIITDCAPFIIDTYLYTSNTNVGTINKAQ